MSWTKTSLFVENTSKGYVWYKKKVPASGIESWEFITQSIVTGGKVEWSPDALVSPNVYATFGDGKKVRISGLLHSKSANDAVVR